MSITTSAGAGVTVTSSAKNGTVKSFTGGKVRLEDPITTGNNGNLASSPTYTGRLIYIDSGVGAGQTRFIVGETLAQGDGNDADLDVHEPWTTNPDNTSGYQISYIIEDVATVSGLTYQAKGDFYSSGRRLTIGSGGGTFAFVFFVNGVFLETVGNGSGTVAEITVENGGRFDVGYTVAGTPVNGAYIVGAGGAGTADSDLLLDAKTGSVTNFNDLQVRGVRNYSWEHDGGTHTWKRCKFFSCCNEMLLEGTVDIDDCYIQGRLASTDRVMLRSTTTIRGLVLVRTNGFNSLDNGATEALEARNVVFVRNLRQVWVHDDKTWSFVNPVNWTGDSTNVVFEVDDLNACHVRHSLDVTVTTPGGTAISDADTYVYRGLLDAAHTPLLPAANIQDTDADGLASSDILRETYTFPSSVFTTTVHSDFALKVYEWLKIPFVKALTVTAGLVEPVAMSADNNVVQTTQATAITNGSGITINNETNPGTLLSYDTGTIAFVAGDTVTGLTSGATGVVTKVEEGDTTSGRIFLKTRNSTAFSVGEALQVSAVTNALATNPLVALDFKRYIDCNALSLQTVYDYVAARLAEDAIQSYIDDAIEWGEDEHALVVFKSGTNYFTERNVTRTEGWFLTNRGAGSVSYMTDDAGTQYVPPTSVTLTVTCKNTAGLAVQGVRVRIETQSGGTLIANGTTNASGVYSAAYNYAGDVAVKIVSRLKHYRFQDALDSITAGGLSVPVTLNRSIYNGP